jgi:release factor glutamine methyltransferase
MTTRNAMLRAAAARLRTEGCDSAELDARVLLKHALQLSDTQLVTMRDEPVDVKGREAFDAMIERRIAGEPVSRIIGQKEFWGLVFHLDPETLVPRPDTETIVEAAVEACPTAPGTILDLGTGTGCILIALLTEFPAAVGVGVDISDDALACAASNANLNGVAGRARFVRGDWGSDIDELFDLVVSNPPYIPHSDIAMLDREVRVHDPMRALDGGRDGLDAYRCVARDAARLLSPDGVLVVELGIGQEAAVAAIMKDAGLEPDVPARPDLSGIPRALVVRRENPLGNHTLND